MTLTTIYKDTPEQFRQMAKAQLGAMVMRWASEYTDGLDHTVVDTNVPNWYAHGFKQYVEDVLEGVDGCNVAMNKTEVTVCMKGTEFSVFMELKNVA